MKNLLKLIFILSLLSVICEANLLDESNMISVDAYVLKRLMSAHPPSLKTKEKRESFYILFF